MRAIRCTNAAYLITIVDAFDPPDGDQRAAAALHAAQVARLALEFDRIDGADAEQPRRFRSCHEARRVEFAQRIVEPLYGCGGIARCGCLPRL
jgi:hypothetical protein